MIGTEFDLGGLTLPQSDSAPRNAELGQAEFLELMLTQIQNQDPFEPMENGAFVAQLAQFSTVTGLGEISTSVAALSDVLLANQTLQASTMVGRSVLVESDEVLLPATGPLRGSVELPIDAASAQIRIKSPNGQLVKEFAVTGKPGSLVEFSWDGITNDGTAAPAGTYAVSASANNGSANIDAPTFTQVQVVSVSLDPSGSGSLITTEDGRELRLTQVRAVM
ncbi:MAG: flagellar hook assembly protein FlgD [Gammaproteobacteria bacterium]|jgi:flagellar basal-body rod modification protein FlgD